MPPTLADRLSHILEAINDIQQLLTGKTQEGVAQDRILRMAIERAFEIISEASRWIPDDVKASQHDIDWQAMAALGNRLRHAYHRVDVEILWTIAERDLPPLRRYVEDVVRNDRRS